MLTVLFASTISFRGYDVGLGAFILAFIGCLLIFVIPILFGSTFLHRLRLRRSTITAEYNPPLDFSPAEISYLFNGNISNRDNAAMIIYLTHRGLLHIKKVNGEKRAFAGPKVEDSLKPHEQLFIDKADCEEGAPTYELIYGVSDKPNTGLNNDNGVKPATVSKLVKERLLKHSYIYKHTHRMCAVYFVRILFINIVALVWLPLMFSIANNTLKLGFGDFGGISEFLKLAILITGALFLLLVLLTTVGLYIKGRISGREWLVDNKLRKHWTHIVGFKHYVQLAEKDKLDFSTAVLKKTSNIDTLPYAVALGYVPNWKDIIL